MGLASDIELYGRERAAKLWTNPGNGKQRSESWISKHLRFKDYGPITFELFEAGLFGDIEAANKMADIEEASASVAAVIAMQMKKGEKLGRNALDLRLTELKNAAKAEQGTERPSPSTGAGPVRSPAASTGHSESLTGVAQGAQNETGLNATPVSAQRSTGAHTTDRETAQLNGKSKTRTGAKDKAERITASVEEIFVTSTSAIHSLRQLRADLAAADTDEDEISWRLWVAFASTACASMVGVGDEHAEKMLQRLVQELNSKSALELLNTLHPSRKAGILPDDFRYDTKRETFPRAPNNWAL
jgi:ParB family chromosome partitioning protein